MSQTIPKNELLSLSNQELTELVQKLGQPSFRARQVADAIFRQRRSALASVSNLPAMLKSKIEEEGFQVGLPRVEQKFTSVDGTVRYLMAFTDGESAETVWMPEGDMGEAGDGTEAGVEELIELKQDPNTDLTDRRGKNQKQNTDLTDRTDSNLDKNGESLNTNALQQPNVTSRNRSMLLTKSNRNSKSLLANGISQSPKKKYPSDPLNPSHPCSSFSTPRARATICVSSQVGCAVNCQFCLTALLGVKRNLSPGEIVGQVIAVLRDHSVNLERERMNIVFMGMGEPFLNYENFMKAARLLVEEVGFPESRMTVSTSGIVPRILEFGHEAIRPKLAISLNAPNDEIRERIMPITRKWSVEALLNAARQFPLRPRERLTFEYVLLNGVNDLPEHAREVVSRVRGIRCKVNLIAFNPGPGVPYTMPGQDRVLEFQSILTGEGVPAFIRRPRGRDIYAACGQLKRTVS